MTKMQVKLWIGLAIMALLTPLGLLLPERFKAAGAWGEWSTEGLAKLVGFVPEGLRKLSALWGAPLPDYGLAGRGASPALRILSYLLSGMMGILIVGAVIYLLLRLIIKNGK